MFRALRQPRLATRAALLASAALLVCGASGARAATSATYTVTTTADDPTPAACTGTSCATLRDALNQVNSDTGSDTIIVPSGTYTLGSALPFVQKSGLDLSISGAGARTTVIDGATKYRVFDFASPTGTVSISGVTVKHGFANDGFGGGGIESSANGLDVTDSTLTANLSEVGPNSASVGNGGAISAAGKVNLTRVTVEGNTAATDGGGVFTFEFGGSTPAGPVTVADSTITGNVVDATLPNTPSNSNEAGGGIEVDNDPLTITNSTIAGNRLAFTATLGVIGSGGGGVYLFQNSSASAKNTVVSGNSPDDCGGQAATFSSAAGPNLDTDSSCFTGTSDLHANPLLGPLANNGGQTDTLALLAGSPAIDHGDNAVCPSSDQRGAARPQGASCDLGAYEAGPPIVSTGGASGVGQSTATVSGTVNPNDQQTTYQFQYGPTTAYGLQTLSQSAGLDYSDHAVAAALSDLAPGTTYHFRVVATSALGTSVGADGTFTTAAAPAGSGGSGAGGPSVPSGPSGPPIGLQPASLTAAAQWIPGGVVIGVGATGFDASGTAQLTSTERTAGPGGKPVGVASARRAAARRTATRQVTVGVTSFSVLAGQVRLVTVTLNALGRRLLTRFGRLPVELTVSASQHSGPTLVVMMERHVIKPVHRRRH